MAEHRSLHLRKKKTDEDIQCKHGETKRERKKERKQGRNKREMKNVEMF